jgi:alcohol dehydrogenase (NADP+)
MKTNAYAAQTATTPLAPFNIQRREVGKHDVAIEILGNLTQVGIPTEPLSLNVGSLVFGRRSLSDSLIGGIKETQEMLDFCGKHQITADIELIPIQQINEAYDRLVKSDVKYRFVIDMASLQH